VKNQNVINSQGRRDLCLLTSHTATSLHPWLAPVQANNSKHTEISGKC